MGRMGGLQGKGAPGNAKKRNGGNFYAAVRLGNDEVG
jgi:hypothetical protein